MLSQVLRSVCQVFSATLTFNIRSMEKALACLYMEQYIFEYNWLKKLKNMCHLNVMRRHAAAVDEHNPFLLLLNWINAKIVVY